MNTRITLTNCRIVRPVPSGGELWLCTKGGGDHSGRDLNNAMSWQEFRVATGWTASTWQDWGITRHGVTRFCSGVYSFGPDDERATGITAGSGSGCDHAGVVS